MTGTGSNRAERQELSRDQARIVAEEYRASGQPDPFENVPPSLLSAEHIRDYVLKTGAIGPFHTGGGRHSRLKKASYEGRIGKCAYRYNKRGMLESVPLEGDLKVGANSIVFVECNLDFRLPDFIALRFNLQIRHVHRGLLLGTGPLVDPGYWGRLCIPLHNLTDEDYSIPLEEGLIWVEFTKTTVNQYGGGSLGRPPLDEKEGHWEIREFVERAARPIGDAGESVPIRSSISKVRTLAERAESNAKRAKRRASGIGIGSAVVATIGLVALAVGLATFVQDAYDAVAQRTGDLERRVSRIEGVSTDTGLQILPSSMKDLLEENEELRERIEILERVVADLQQVAQVPR